MWFRLNNGKMIEVIKSQFTTDKMYYEYIMTLFLSDNSNKL
jgi:hypothetical protein